MPFVKLPRLLQQLTNQQDTLEISGNTIVEALLNLSLMYPALKPYIFNANNQPMAYISFYINGRNFPQHTLDSTIKNTDILELIPALAGG